MSVNEPVSQTAVDLYTAVMKKLRIIKKIMKLSYQYFHIQLRSYTQLFTKAKGQYNKG